MDNIAKIATNPNSWPQFSAVGNGVTQVSDSGGGSLALTWNARTITNEVLGLNAQRNLQENWQMAPVTDPDRLRAMRTVYYYTLYGSLPPATFDYDPRGERPGAPYR
jgi:hypothetical protein